jgi:hypothetical protein
MLTGLRMVAICARLSITDLHALTRRASGWAWRRYAQAGGCGPERTAIVGWAPGLGVCPIRAAAAGSSVMVADADLRGGPADQSGGEAPVPAPRLRSAAWGAIDRNQR